MDYNDENVRIVAQKIVDTMGSEQVCKYVLENLVQLMSENKDLFDEAVSDYGPWKTCV